MKDLSIIIVNYNTFQLTSNCIKSLHEKLTGLEYEIILVDNASVERDAEDFKKTFPDIILVKSPVNGGFAKGNNLGIEKASGKYILLLNSDCELTNNAPLISYRYMEAHPECGLSTVQLHYPDGKIQYNCRRFRYISWELLELFPVYWLLPKKRREELMLHHYFDHKWQVDCDWVWGAYMFFPRNILQQFPGNKLAEDFFMYCEDTLWCWQVKQLGLKITFLPEGKVMHVHKGSSRSKKKEFQNISNKNHIIFMRYIYKNWNWKVFKLIFNIKQNIISLLR